MILLMQLNLSLHLTTLPQKSWKRNSNALKPLLPLLLQSRPRSKLGKRPAVQVAPCLTCSSSLLSVMTKQMITIPALPARKGVRAEPQRLALPRALERATSVSRLAPTPLSM